MQDFSYTRIVRLLIIFLVRFYGIVQGLFSVCCFSLLNFRYEYKDYSQRERIPCTSLVVSYKDFSTSVFLLVFDVTYLQGSFHLLFFSLYRKRKPHTSFSDSFIFPCITHILPPKALSYEPPDALPTPRTSPYQAFNDCLIIPAVR